MQYSYNGWKLYSREVELRNNSRPFRIYFFSKNMPKSGTEVNAEEFRKMNVIVGENPKTGMPYIKKR